MKFRKTSPCSSSTIDTRVGRSHCHRLEGVVGISWHPSRELSIRAMCAINVQNLISISVVDFFFFFRNSYVRRFFARSLCIVPG